MRAARTGLLLGALALAGVASGRVEVALALAGAKAALVGWEFLELRHAARAHAVGWLLAVLGLAFALAAGLAFAP